MMMSLTLTRALTVCCMILFGIQGNAQSITEFRYYYDNGDFQAAYTEGKNLITEVGGGIEFELAFAEAARKIGRTDDAIFALERVLWSEPDNLIARVMLSEIYAKIGNRQLALEQASYVLLVADELAYEERAKSVIANIKRPILTLGGKVGLSVSHEQMDQVNRNLSKSNRGSIFTDFFTSLTSITGNKITVGIKISGDRYPKSNSDNTDKLELYTNARLKRGNWGYRTDHGTQKTFQKGSVYSEIHNTSFGIDRTFNKGLRLSGTVELSRTFSTNNDNDSERFSLNVLAAYKLPTEIPINIFGGITRVSTIPYLKNENTLKEVDSETLVTKMGAALSLQNDLVWSIGAFKSDTKYGNPSIPRKDNRRIFATGISWQNSEKTKIDFSITRTTNSSNYANYSFRRNQLSLTYTIGFGG